MSELKGTLEDLRTPSESESHLRDYLHVVLRRWKMALGLALAVFCAVAIFTVLQEPVYEAFTTIEIRKGSKGGVLGAMGLESPDNLAADIQLLQSRSMAEKVAQRLNLHWQHAAMTEGLDISLREFVAADNLSQVELVLTGADAYRVLLNGREVAAGRSGQPLQIDGLRLLVDIGRGVPGDRVRLERIPLAVAAGQIMGAVRATEVGRGTNILRLSAQNSDPQLAREMANQLAQIYQEQSASQKSQEAGKTVDFIDQQLGGLRDVLNRSEQELKEYKVESGLITLGPEGTRLIEQLVTLEQQKVALDMSARRIRFAIDALQAAIAARRPFSPPALAEVSASEAITRLGEMEAEKKALLAEFTEAHPAVIDVESKIRRGREALLAAYKTALQGIENEMHELTQTIAGFDAELNKVPEAELVLAQKTRDNQVNAEIYTFLLQKQQEARIAEASTISNVAIIDPAFTPLKPIKPNKKKNFLLGAVLGLMFGVGLAFFLDYMDQTVKDAEGARRALRLPVLGTIPCIPTIEGAERRTSLVSSLPPRSAPVEAFRSLRTGIHFAAAGEDKKIIMVTSALPGEGKSTVSANLALVLAQTGAKVLLVGCDLRRPSLAEAFGQPNVPGLSDLLTQGSQRIVRQLHSHRIDFLSGGTIPPNPAELLGSAQMGKLLAAARARYDYVILDAPPVLPVTDAQILAPLAEMVLIVLETCRIPVKAVHKMREDLLAVKAPVVGVVMNDKTGKGFQYYGGYSYYGHKLYGSYYVDEVTSEKRKMSA